MAIKPYRIYFNLILMNNIIIYFTKFISLHYITILLINDFI